MANTDQLTSPPHTVLIQYFFLSVVFLYSLWQAVMLDSSGSGSGGGGSCFTVCWSDAVHLFFNSLNFQWVFIELSLLNQFVDARKFDIKATCNHLFEWWRGPPLFVKSNLQMDLNDGSLTLLPIKEVEMFFFLALFFCLANPFHFFAFQFIEETFMILSKLIFRPKWFIRLRGWRLFSVLWLLSISTFLSLFLLSNVRCREFFELFPN